MGELVERNVHKIKTPNTKLIWGFLRGPRWTFELPVISLRVIVTLVLY